MHVSVVRCCGHSGAPMGGCPVVGDNIKYWTLDPIYLVSNSNFATLYPCDLEHVVNSLAWFLHL